MDTTCVRQQVGLLARSPDGAPIAAEMGSGWLSFVVEADVTILQQRTGDTHVDTPAGVVMNWSPGPSGPQEQLEVQPVGVVTEPDGHWPWTFDARHAIKQRGRPDQCVQERRRLADCCSGRQVRHGSQLVEDG
jgi:hypothetical protein